MKGQKREGDKKDTDIMTDLFCSYSTMPSTFETIISITFKY